MPDANPPRNASAIEPNQTSACGLLSVRPIAADDWRAYRAIRLRALQETPSAFGSSWSQEATWGDEVWMARAQASASGEAGRGFFAVDHEVDHHDAICGLVWCMLAPADPTTAHIYSMWVAPTARGRGAGKVLLTQCIDWARQAGARQVRLSVAAGNSLALRLYLALGFAPLGQTEPLRAGAELSPQDMVLNLA